MKINKIFVGLIVLNLSSAARAVGHPFDDLNPREIQSLVEGIKKSGKFGKEIRFPIVRTNEPRKAEWLKNPSAYSKREAFALVFDYEKNAASEIVYDLKTNKIVSSTERTGIQPPVLVEEFEAVPKIAKADIRWQNAMKKRGLHNFDDIYVDVWAPGVLTPEEQKSGARFLRGMSYVKGKNKNSFARPIEGVIVTVDLKTRKVFDVWDDEDVPVAKGSKELDVKSQKELREPLKPLVQTQPKGSSFTVKGQEVSWQGWKLRYSFDVMRGLQIYHVTFKDRSVLYKANLSDMLVPYGAPGRTWTFRNAFDVGEYGLGRTAQSLKKGKDVPGYATLIDAHMTGDTGQVITLPGAVAIYERSSGILWKHWDAVFNTTEQRGGRELVLMFFTTIGNYDYGIQYILQQDGTIKVNAVLTGILLARGSALEEVPCKEGCVPLVEKNMLAPPHQHFFNFRVDLDVGGASHNRPVEMNVESVPSKMGNEFHMVNTTLKNEKDAQRFLNLDSSRSWKVVHTQLSNGLKHPIGYKLMPGENSQSFLKTDHPARKRAGFLEGHVWFTKYSDEEQSAAGNYPNQWSGPSDGLTKYVGNDEGLDDQDVVLWYTLGHTHVPRPEDWPIMNAHHTGFSLMPVHFFDQNPAMDLRE